MGRNLVTNFFYLGIPRYVSRSAKVIRWHGIKLRRAGARTTGGIPGQGQYLAQTSNKLEYAGHNGYLMG